MSMRALSRPAGAAFDSLRDACGVCRKIYPVMVLLIIAVKILSELDLIKYLAMPLEPLMALMGLPADFGIIWATSMVVNIYSGLIVLISLLPAMEPLSVAQMSIFGLITLYAHSLPIEGRIAQQCGLAFTVQIVLRILVATAAGIGLHLLCRETGWLSEPAIILFSGGDPNPPLPAWIWGHILDLVYIYLIIAALLFVQRGIEHFKLDRWLALPLKPFVRLIGLSDKASTIIMIGLCMGLIYGSGLIIRAAQDGSLSRRDIFGSVTLMGLAHAIIEDTLLFLVIGGNWIVILALRTLLAIGVVAVVMRARDRINPLPETA